MTYTIPPDSPKAASAAAFGRELVRACAARNVPRTELHRATGIGRTTLDHYRTGSSLPRIAAASALAAVLDWPKLVDIVREARTRACKRCGRPFSNDGGNLGAKRYCGVPCRDAAEQERIASTRLRQAGHLESRAPGLGGVRQREAIARLRSGLRIAEEQTRDLRAAIDAMCRDCEPMGACRTVACPLRPYSPLPLGVHETGETRTNADVRRDLNRKAAPKRAASMRRRWADGAHRTAPAGDVRLPANDPARREAWIESIRRGKARRKAA